MLASGFFGQLGPAMLVALLANGALASYGYGSYGYDPLDESNYKPADIIRKDVAIIGGGASGTYAAVRLRDSGKTFALVEQKGHLGGHVDTYTDPTTGYPIDYGVSAYLDLPGVKDFFTRFQIPTTPFTDPGWTNAYLDFATGKPVPGYPKGSQADVAAALTTYAGLAGKYNDYYFPGYGKLAAGAVPEELLLPFGQLVAKYNLTAALPVIWTFASGVGDFAKTPSLYVFSNFGAVVVQGVLTGSLFVPVSHNNSALYGAAQTYLGSDDVLLNSQVSVAKRGSKSVKLVVQTPHGAKLLKAKKLLVTIPPTKDNLTPFGLDATERSVFGKWRWENWYVAIFTGSGLPSNYNIVNAKPKPSALWTPTPSFVWRYTSTGIRDLYTATVVGRSTLSKQGAKGLIRAGLGAFKEAGTFATKSSIEFVAWAKHAPLQLAVSAKELKGGFYGELYGLQGKKSTWYTGAAWAPDYTSILWVFTEAAILPGLLAGL